MDFDVSCGLNLLYSINKYVVGRIHSVKLLIIMAMKGFWSLIDSFDVIVRVCGFHLGQVWYRKIQALGLATDYKDRSSDISKWLAQFFGMPFLPSEEVEEGMGEHQIVSTASGLRIIGSELCDKWIEISTLYVGRKPWRWRQTNQ
jgi:hypothetical protein